MQIESSEIDSKNAITVTSHSLQPLAHTPWRTDGGKTAVRLDHPCTPARGGRTTVSIICSNDADSILLAECSFVCRMHVSAVQCMRCRVILAPSATFLLRVSGRVFQAILAPSTCHRFISFIYLSLRGPFFLSLENALHSVSRATYKIP